MKTSKVVILSVFITSVILIMIGGVTSTVLANKNASQQAAVQAAAAPAVPAQSVSQMDPAQAVQLYQKREASYQQMLQQANQQIEKANADLQAMQNQMAQLQQQQPTAQVAASTAISADKANEIAQKAVDPGMVALKKPDLVNFQGKTAYEVVFDSGSVYVEVQSGEVLFNGTIPQQITADKAAQIAADYLKDKGILQVDQITFRGAPLYRVIFKDGLMAYLDMTGQITYVQKIVPGAPQQVSAGAGSGGPSGGGSSHQWSEHEGGGNGEGD